MNSSPNNKVPFVIWDVFHRMPNEPFWYRIRTGSPAIKYLVAPRPPSGLPDYQGRYLAFSTVPEGDWNTAHLEYNDDGTGQLRLGVLEKTQLKDAGPVWHAKQVDELDLEAPLGLDDNATPDMQCHDQFGARVFRGPPSITTAAEVVGVRDWHANFMHGIAQETLIYSLIHGQGIAPQFLGHIMEKGTRLIGFLVEHVAAREAAKEDLKACKEVLSRLHGLGIAYPTITRDSFLILDNGTALLQGFAGCFKTTDRAVFDRELNSVEDVLKDKPVPTSEDLAAKDELSRKMTEFQSQGHTHPFVHWQIFNLGHITITADEHRRMLRELERNDYRWTAEDEERAVDQMMRQPAE
ncbi:hypothetical protein CONLIGDRAFT_699567 [Coniochaeta ligniaria NRRL 30616]|uniref:Aminoglycoside phosphotransferase domain-containing protein n=1 Tax=Coniochaeta ligniaria NRRL 30616 TaxID=1408157 RepID=A0A1J7JTI5_9PEZI|nr:hypothetical protein CONLIGDRAFT_699567 [Coniochaeta ligniaria NRRL 30616]